MAILIATPGAADANSYATVAEGDAYHETRLFVATWSAATSDTKARSLMQATRLLDAYLTWRGSATFPDQALGFPRTGLRTRNGQPLPSDVIPPELRNATSEFARLLIAADLQVTSETEAQGITRLKAGPVELQFREELEAVLGGRVLPPTVIAMIPPDWYEAFKDPSKLFALLEVV